MPDEAGSEEAVLYLVSCLQAVLARLVAGGASDTLYRSTNNSTLSNFAISKHPQDPGHHAASKETTV